MPIFFFPIISQWQQKVAIATRVLIRLGQKTILFVPPAYRCYMWNMARIGFMASEEMSFENVGDDERRRTDGRRMPDYIISSPISLRLRWAKKRILIVNINYMSHVIRKPVLWHTVMILSFRTDMPGQTVQTQIKLRLEEQSDQGLHCLPFCLDHLDSLLYGRAT